MWVKKKERENLHIVSSPHDVSFLYHQYRNETPHDLGLAMAPPPRPLPMTPRVAWVDPSAEGIHVPQEATLSNPTGLKFATGLPGDPILSPRLSPRCVVRVRVRV